MVETEVSSLSGLLSSACFSGSFVASAFASSVAAAVVCAAAGGSVTVETGCLDSLEEQPEVRVSAVTRAARQSMRAVVFIIRTSFFE